MNSWMTPTRQRLARQYVHDMINSFVEDPQGADYHDEYDPPYVSFYSPDIERLLEKACHNDRYSVKHPEFACCTVLTIAFTILMVISCGRLAVRFTSISMALPLINSKRIDGRDTLLKLTRLPCFTYGYRQNKY